MKTLKVGAYSESSNDFGPLITKEHRDKVVSYIDSAEEQGASIIVDGRSIKVITESIITNMNASG